MATRPQFATNGPDQEFHRFPVSVSQAHLWGVHGLTSGTNPSALMAALRLRGPLNLPAFQQALEEIFSRHEILRTIVQEVAGEPAQFVAAVAPQTLQVIDLRNASPEEHAVAYQQTLHQLQDEISSSAPESLFRATLLRFAEQDQVCLFAAHALVFDAFSCEILLEEMATLYADFATGRGASLPALKIQYPDFAVWQLEGQTSPAFRSQSETYYETQELGESLPHVRLTSPSFV